MPLGPKTDGIVSEWDAAPRNRLGRYVRICAAMICDKVLATVTNRVTGKNQLTIHTSKEATIAAISHNRRSL